MKPLLKPATRSQECVLLLYLPDKSGGTIH